MGIVRKYFQGLARNVSVMQMYLSKCLSQNQNIFTFMIENRPSMFPYNHVIILPKYY